MTTVKKLMQTQEKLKSDIDKLKQQLNEKRKTYDELSVKITQQILVEHNMSSEDLIKLVESENTEEVQNVQQ